MKKISNKLKAVFSVLKALIAVIIAIAAHVYRSGDAFLSGVVILICIISFFFYAYNAYVKFKGYSLDI